MVVGPVIVLLVLVVLVALILVRRRRRTVRRHGTADVLSEVLGLVPVWRGETWRKNQGGGKWL